MQVVAFNDFFQNWKLHCLRLTVRTCQEAASQKEHSQKNPSVFNDELLVSSTVLHMVVMESLEGFSEFPFMVDGWLVSTMFFDFQLSPWQSQGEDFEL